MRPINLCATYETYYETYVQLGSNLDLIMRLMCNLWDPSIYVQFMRLIMRLMCNLDQIWIWLWDLCATYETHQSMCNWPAHCCGLPLFRSFLSGIAAGGRREQTRLVE
jgi:hypothetical protein